MSPARRFFYRPAQRLRRRKDFEQVYRARRRFETRWFVIHYRASEHDHDRLGLSVSRRVGGAVRRSRVKRVLRELFRSNPDERGPWLDMIVAPKAGISEAGYQELQSCWREATGKIRLRFRR